MAFLSDAEYFKPGYIRGFVFAPDAAEMRWAVGLFHNARLIGTYFADGDTQTDAPPPDVPPDCGFEFNLSTAVLAQTDTLTMRVLNGDHVISHVALNSMKPWRDPDTRLAAGSVRHAHGLTISGHLDHGITETPSFEILAFDGDDIVGRSRFYRWQHIGDPRKAMARAVAFDLFVDPRLADAVPRKLRIETSTGMALKGSPVDFIAYPNDFRDACLDAGGGPLAKKSQFALDRLLENSAPMTAYGEYYPQLRHGLNDARTEAFGDHGRIRHFPETGMSLVFNTAVIPRADIRDLLPDTAADIVCFDLAVERSGGFFPLLFPAFDWERLLEQGYAAHCFAAPTPALKEALKRGADTPFAVFLALAAACGRDRILHVPHPAGVLHEAHLEPIRQSHVAALRGANPPVLDPETRIETRPGSVFPCAHVQRPVQDRGVSVLIPTRNEGWMLKDCIDSLRAQNPGFDLDICVVDNGSSEAKSLKILDKLEADGVRILEFDAGFNFSVINNLAAEHARHEQLCFLNNDIQFTEPGVLSELCGRLSDPGVGAAGPLMTRASDIIQHGGVVLGPNNGACHAFEDRMLHDPGYGEMLRVARDVPAVTGAMLVTRKSLFDRLGGFEEHLFSVNFNDVDYCLRLWEAGHRVVFSPHARIRHFESVSRGRESMTPSGNRMLREVQNLRLRWRDVIRNDPFFHPLLSIDTLPYRALCTRHRDPAPRTSIIRASSDLPSWI